MDFTTDPTMSLLPLDGTEAPVFDYTVYLQQQDMDYLAESSSSTSSFSPAAIQQQAFASPQPFSIGPSPISLQSLASPEVGSGAVVLRQHSHDSTNHHPSPPSPNHHTQQQPNPKTGKQRLERRGHTKSRRGCFNCKRRRIKCQETKPSCGHCIKTGLECIYPPPPTNHQHPSSSSPTTSPSSSSSPSLITQPQHPHLPAFTLLDLRLFHHFLSTCYPHHPIGSEPLWTHEIPCLSQSYPYLMHAILGYSASDLADTSSPSSQDSSLVTAAMTHRLKAIKAIKKTLEEITDKRGEMVEEGNALMATCFALTYQSVLLDDGMVEYMTFIRGIVIVAIQMYVGGQRERSKMLFGEFIGPEKSQRRLEPFMREVGLIKREWVDSAMESINRLEGLLLTQEKEVEREYWGFLKKMGECLYTSSWKAYIAMTEHYGWWMMLSHERFQRVIEPGNQLGVLLATHWISLKQIMSVITETEEKASGDHDKGKGQSQKKEGGNDISLGIIRWLKYLNGLVDDEHRRYNRWPEWVEGQLDLDRGFFGRTH